MRPFFFAFLAWNTACFGADTTFEKLRLQLQFQTPPPTVLYIGDPTGNQSEVRELAFELKRIAGPLWVVTEESGQIETLRKALQATERDDIEIYQVLPAQPEAGEAAEPFNRILYVPRRWDVSDPYYEPTGEPLDSNGTYENRRSDDSGRDLLAAFLFNVARESAPVEVLLRNGHGLDIAAEIITRAKYEGIPGGSPGVVFKVSDLVIDGGPGGYGDAALRFIQFWPHLAKSLKETRQGLDALQSLTTEFTFLEATTPQGIRPHERSEKWLAGEIPVTRRVLTREEANSATFAGWLGDYREGRAQREFSTSDVFQTLMKDAIEVKLFQGVEPQSNLEMEAGLLRHQRSAEQRAAYNAALARITNLLPTADTATQEGWKELRLEFDKAEAWQLTALERQIFTEGSAPLQSFRRTGELPDLIALMNQDPQVVVHLMKVGEPTLRRDLDSLVMLHRKLDHLIHTEPVEDYRMYWLRRHSFGRGVDLGGRWAESVERCSRTLAKFRAR